MHSKAKYMKVGFFLAAVSLSGLPLLRAQEEEEGSLPVCNELVPKNPVQCAVATFCTLNAAKTACLHNPAYTSPRSLKTECGEQDVHDPSYDPYAHCEIRSLFCMKKVYCRFIDRGFQPFGAARYVCQDSNDVLNGEGNPIKRYKDGATDADCEIE